MVIFYIYFASDGNIAVENKSENVDVENEKEKIANEKNDSDDDGDNGNKEEDNDDNGEAVKGQATDDSKEELAVRIYNTISSTILPQLHKCVTKKVCSKDKL